MSYTGVIIEESLKDKSVLGKVKILKTVVEKVTERHQTPYLKQWTLHTVEIPDEQAEILAEIISQSFERGHNDWYADYKNNKHHFIIYPDKIFKVDLENPVGYRAAKEYGISLGIPYYQVNFGHDI